MPTTLSDILDRIECLRGLYDVARIVDPLLKRIVECETRGSDSISPEACYSYWCVGDACDNCISVRAYREQREFVKLEHGPHKVMLVQAVPLQDGGGNLVLELIKDVTGTMMVGRGSYGDGSPLEVVIDRLNAAAVRDELTSLFNRRFLNDRLPSDIAVAVRRGDPLSVIFLDVDDTKLVNDAYGHVVGDGAILLAGDIIRENIRTDQDWAVRYGGDEFLVCLDRTGLGEAEGVARRMRDGFRGTSLSVDGHAIHLSVSMGVAAMPAGGCTAEEIVRLADEKMYEEKRGKGGSR